MGFAVRVRSAGQKYGPTCHQRDRADVTEFVTLVRLSSLGQHVGVLGLAGYKRRKSALTAGPIGDYSLEAVAGIRGAALAWLRSYIPPWQDAECDRQWGPVNHCGSQYWGSAGVGPGPPSLLGICHTFVLRSVIERYPEVRHHGHADDRQL